MYRNGNSDGECVMGDALKVVFGFCLGAFIVGYVLAFNRMLVSQEAFADGKKAALSRIVTLDGPEPCNINVPLSALADLANTGMLDWHKACVDAASGQERE